MTKNPILNAFGALGYIAVIATGMNLAARSRVMPNPYLAPIVMLSLFTLSAGVMGYIFCGQPLMLYLDGKKKQAVQLFLKTLLTFGAMTLILLIVLLSGIFPGRW